VAKLADLQRPNGGNELAPRLDLSFLSGLGR